MAAPKDPIFDKAIFHRGLYDEFATAEFEDEVSTYRNYVKELFVKQVVLKGTHLVENLNKNIKVRIQ